MKLRTPLFCGLMAAAMSFGGVALAQDAPAPAASAAMAGSGNASSGNTSGSYQTPQGQVVINSAPAPAPTIGPAPDFKTLSGGSKGITPAQAASYPPLANDFINADSNKDGKVSKSEYARWVKQLQ